MDDYIVKKSEDIVKCVMKHGFAIMEDILNQNECKNMRDGAWSFFESVSKLLKRNDQDSWSYIFDLCPTRDMLYQCWGIGQAQYLWDIRQNPKIISIYRRIWNSIYEYRGTNYKAGFLKVSFEGASFLLPPEITNRGWDGPNWFHINQKHECIELKNIKSMVTSEDINVGDSTLVFLKGSNLKYETAGIRSNKQDRYYLSDDDIYNYYNGCEQIEITCKAGSMIFWDPRTVHYSKGVDTNREVPNLRNTAYLCYTPREYITAQKCKLRMNAFNEFRTSTSWPDRNELLPEIPTKFNNNYFRDELLNYPKIPPILNEFGFNLI